MSTAAGRLCARWAMPLALLLAVGALGAAIGLAPLLSFDYWWHLRTGQLIVETGAVPRVDPYSYTAAGARWIDTHWLFQLALHGLYQLGGHQAVRLAKGACVLTLLALLGSIGWRRSRAALSALALGCLLMASAHRLIERPELVSFLLLALLLALLDRHRRRGDAWVFAILPLQLLWANLHSLFAVGLGVCALALLAELVQPWWQRGEALRRDRVRDLALVTALSLGVSCLTPNGPDTLLFPLEQLGMIGLAGPRSDLGRHVVELQPILEVPGGLATLAWAGGLALLAMLLNGRRVPAFDLLLFLAFLVLTLGAERNAALLAIASVPIAVRNLDAFLERHPAPRWAARAAALAVLAGLALAVAAREHEQGAIFLAAAVTPDLFPEAAAEWIAREHPEGPLYHAMGDGGYLIWRLYPDYRVMLDGRLEVFGAQRFEPLSVRASGSPAGFERLDARHRFGVVLLHHLFYPHLQLLHALHRSPEWRLVQLDEVAAIFVRAQDGAQRWPELGADGADPLPPLGPEGDRRRDLWRRTTRIALLGALERPEHARALARETCRLYADEPLLAELCRPEPREAARR